MTDKTSETCSDLQVYRNTRRASRRYTPLSSPRPSHTPLGSPFPSHTPYGSPCPSRIPFSSPRPFHIPDLYRSISQIRETADDGVERFGMVSSQPSPFDWSQDDQRLNRWEYIHAHQNQGLTLKPIVEIEHGSPNAMVVQGEPSGHNPDTFSCNLDAIEVPFLSDPGFYLLT
jgi:hypothetical protein